MCVFTQGSNSKTDHTVFQFFALQLMSDQYILLQSLLNYIPYTYIILLHAKNTNITLCIQSLEAMCKCFLLSERKRRYSTPSLSSTYNDYRAFRKYTKLPFLYCLCNEEQNNFSNKVPPVRIEPGTLGL